MDLEPDERAESTRFRRALAIAVRRRWHAVYDHRSGLWKLSEFLGTGEFLRFIRANRWPDPVTAILEADAWYVANIDPTNNPAPRKD